MLAAPFLGLLLAGSVGAGNYSPPPGDCCLQWSPHGTEIVFAGNRGSGVAVGVVSPSGGRDRLVPGISVGLRSPDWTHVGYVKDGWLAVSRVDGTDEHLIVKSYGGLTWSPDSKRVAVVTDTGFIDVAHADGSGLTTIARGGSPAWSSTNRIAYVVGQDRPQIHVVRADGSGDVNVTAGSGRPNASPVWSPDGSRLAFWSSDNSTADLAVARVGGATRFYVVPGSSTNGAALWAPDGKTVFGAGTAGLEGIELATARRHTLTGISNGVFSPDGRLIAFTAGGECRDRVGIYIASAEGTARRRISNSCSIFGTDGPDVLHGSFSQVVFGLGGNDTLYADDTYYYFDGDTLYGGPGNDLLVGGDGQDKLNGGPGNDTLDGGPSGDILVGGPGHDRINGNGGGDTIYAVDGQRDWITCGKNAYDRRDVVYTDRIDVVASDCEIVHRS